MQQQTITAMLAIMGAYLLGGVSAGETLAPRLRSQQLKLHDVDGLHKDQYTGSISLLATLLPAGNLTALPGSIDNIETTLADLAADKVAGKATPGMENFANTVKKMIKDEMLPEIRKGHNDAVRTLNNFRLGFRRCAKIRTVSKGPIKAMNILKGSTSKNHKGCRRIENGRYGAKEKCKKVVAAKYRAKKAACDAFAALHRKPETQADKCKPTKAREPYHLWLVRNRQYFTSKFDAYVKAEKLCRLTTLDWRRVKVPCDRKIGLWKGQRNKCKTRQRSLETATCTLGKKMKDTCDKYDTCHDTQAALYRKQKPTLKTQEKDRKGEFRALKRIECLLKGVFGGPTVDTKAIDKCKKITHSTKWLNLRYPPIPGKIKCPVLPSIPGEKTFRVLEFSRLSKFTPPVRVSKCVLSPAGGIILGVQSTQRKYKNYCSVSNGWLSAQNGGSCLISQRDGIPVQINYKRARYTKFRFIMKMDEKSTRNAYKGGGGFAMCNNDGVSWRSGSPAIQFVDAKKPSQWGYKLTPAWKSNPLRLRKPVTCKQLMTKDKVWGNEARGMDLSKYTGNKMKWIGCMGDGCQPKDFYCTQKRDAIVFGAKGTMRAVLGRKIPAKPKTKLRCGSRKNPAGMFNLMDKTKDINRLCKSLGYTRGTILFKKKQNFCPGVASTKSGWGSTYRVKTSYGSKFRCQGPVSYALYSSKKYYKTAEPSKGRSVQWSVTMMYYKGQYSLKSLQIGGRSFNGYAGRIAKCAARGPYGFAPRIVSQAARGKVYIKDFRVFQGNSMHTKKMKQVIGQGVSKTSEQAMRKKLRRALRYAYKTFEVYRMQILNIKKPTWYRMWAEAKRKNGRLMTAAEAKLFINRRKGVLFKGRDYWAAVTNPRERRAKGSKWGKKDWIQLGSRPHPPKTSHSAKFGYPGWGDNSRAHRGGATTSVLLYVTKARRKYVVKRIRLTRVVRKNGKLIKKTKIIKRKVPKRIPKKVLKRKVNLFRRIKKVLAKPKRSPPRRRVCQRRYRITRHRRNRYGRRCWGRWIFRRCRNVVIGHYWYTRKVPFTHCYMVRR